MGLVPVIDEWLGILARRTYNSRMKSNAPTLSDILLATSQAIAEVESGRSLTDALSKVTPACRPASQSLAFYAMRHWGEAMALRSMLVNKSPPKAQVNAFLGLSLCLLNAEPALYPDHTLVDQSVEALGSRAAFKPYKSLVNAVLRRFLREKQACRMHLAQDLRAQWNHPVWWVEKLRLAYPRQWQDLLAMAQTHPPMTIRVNRCRASQGMVLTEFLESGIEAEPFGQSGLVLKSARPLHQLPGFDQGRWSVQDAGAQLAAELLDVRDGMRVLDACAAPGGKTAHLLELADLDLTALDVDPARLDRVKDNLDRLGLSSNKVKLKAASVLDVMRWWDGHPYDAILADVPCTASGIVRRHPDIRWLRREHDVAKTARLQAQIVDVLWNCLKPHGKLLYVTCSIFPEEGEMQAQGLMARHPDAVRLSAPGQLLPTAPTPEGPAGHDGFFYALFEKQPDAARPTP